MQKRKAPPKTDAQARPRKKQALGMGLGALIPEIDSLGTPPAKEYLQCDVALIQPNRYQPRLRFPEEDLAELADSIRAQGVIQPLLVRKADSGYELVTGERRLRASKLAGLTRVPIVVKALTDAQLLEMSIVENIQRENLNPIEEAEAYHRLITEFKLTQEETARRVGKSRPAVANFLRLRQLPEPIKAGLMDGRLSMGHARALLGIESAAQQQAAWQAILAKGLSVRETEKLIQRLKAERKKSRKGSRGSDQIYFASLAEELSRRFGTKVQIKRRGKRGKVEIDFYTDDDLDRLLRVLNPE